MKRMNYLSVIVAVFVMGQALAYDHDYGKANTGVVDKPVSHTRGAGCAPANYRLTMEFNDVSAQLETGGLLFLDRANGVATYRVPKTGQATAIYAGSLWMGGLTPSGQLRIAAVKFRNTGNDFWPGPLTVDIGSGNYNPNEAQGDNTIRDHGAATVTPEVCAEFDKIFVVSKAEVIAFITYWECHNDNIYNPQHIGCDDGAGDIPSSEIMQRIVTWPGNGALGQDPFLAPYYDRDNSLDYNPLDGGDYPFYDDILGRDFIDCQTDRRTALYGDQTYWWVFNDQGNIHSESGAQNPIGMEIHAQAFAFATDDEINKMTFYNYELINRGTQTLKDTYFSQYMDADLGGYDDDYVGCDVSRGLGYCYNGDLVDETVNGKAGYGEHPPAIGVDFFEGPYMDADGRDNGIFNNTLDAIADSGIVYPGLGIGYGDSIVDNERFGMRRFCYYNAGGNAGTQDPTTAAQFYNYMQGSWRFGDEMYYGGTGYTPSNGVTTTPADYMFPGDSDPLGWGTQGNIMVPWSEYDLGTVSGSNPPGDRRFVQSAGPFELKPGAVNNITVGIVYARSTQGGIFASVDALKRADTKAQALFDNCFRIMEPPHAPVMRVQELKNELILMLDNPKLVSNNQNEEYAREDDINIQDPNDSTEYDKYYRFEGYQIFQVRDDETTITDLEDPTQARLVAQCDIENGVSRLINYEYDEELELSYPIEKVDGEDKGIRHTFRITEDQFASGSRTLVNHKTYYYIAVAYAYNNYKTYDPDDGTALDGQKKPYLRSRINADGSALKPMAAVPHHPAPENDGTLQQAVYGQTPRITRLDGYGNGRAELAFTPETEAEIVSTGYMERPEYDYNSGPLRVKVVDPLNLAGGYFECRFADYNSIDSASWYVVRYTEEGGDPIDTVFSEATISMDNEQVIAEWGISVQIHQDKHYFPGSGGGNLAARYADPLSATYEFADSSKRWLGFIGDNAALYPTNWIRTGTFNPDDCPPGTTGYLDECLYPDEIGLDPGEQYSKLLGGGIAPHKVTGYQGDFMPLAYPDSFPSFATSRYRASLAFLPSVLIVITKDKEKWTRCPVVELGRDSLLNVNYGQPGELRRSLSVDKQGRKAGDPGYNPAEGDFNGSQPFGMGWFPGYVLDLETGARLHMAFGENSFLGAQNGADMQWNPTSNIMDNNGVPVMGGQHPVYIFGTKVGYGNFSTESPYYDGVNNWVYDQYMAGTTQSYAELFESLMWIMNPILEEGHELNETDVRISVSVSKEYKNYTASGLNGGKPMYSWNMDDIRTQTSSREQLASVLDMINVVPNPYYAFSEYERDRLDNRVKITNLPERCTVTIYNVGGKLIRTFKKDNEVTSIDWDLKNAKGIPIASGVYIIHVDVPGAGEKIVKFFGGMRQVDLENI
jgi:hypothetical protein